MYDSTLLKIIVIFLMLVPGNLLVFFHKIYFPYSMI